jgi:hypothetical protein
MAALLFPLVARIHRYAAFQSTRPARCRQMRLWAIERATLQSEIEKHDPESHDAAPSLSLALRALADQSRTLNLINRQESRFDRRFVPVPYKIRFS